MSLSYTWWKKSVYNNFRAFFIIFDQANACASMCSLVEIHNTYHVTWFWECPLKEKNKISLICFVYLNLKKLAHNFNHMLLLIFVFIFVYIFFVWRHMVCTLICWFWNLILGTTCHQIKWRKTWWTNDQLTLKPCSSEAFGLAGKQLSHFQWYPQGTLRNGRLF